ncbi:MAG: hypothetical protein APR62_08395 [Smithella sp. SDB]|nr:MAG: hypothetical protein APR62_08395 [Smithella sp. SDB]
MNYVKENKDISEKALISVIIPAHNGEDYVAEAIDSVLAQEYKNTEIIAINDGSTDATEDVVRSYAKVHYLYQPRQGASTARNSGIKISSGEFIAFLDADDIWTKNKLKIQMSQFLTNPELDMIFGHVEQFYSPELAESLEGKIHLAESSMPGYVPGTMLIKKTSFLKVGFFDDGYRIGEFIDWYMRAIDYGLKSFLTQEVVLKRRIHNANTGIRDRDFRKDYLRVLKASLDRRREREQKAGVPD